MEQETERTAQNYSEPTVALGFANIDFASNDQVSNNDQIFNGQADNFSQYFANNFIKPEQIGAWQDIQNKFQTNDTFPNNILPNFEIEQEAQEDPTETPFKDIEHFSGPEKNKARTLPASDKAAGDGAARKGQVKDQFSTRFEEGDRIKATTSVYKSGRTTGSGLPFNTQEFTVAHKQFPFGTILKITNPSTGAHAHAVVTDNGPFVAGRTLDISVGVANHIGMGFTVKNLDLEVAYIPKDRPWGNPNRNGARPNVHGQTRREIEETIRRLNVQQKSRWI